MRKRWILIGLAAGLLAMAVTGGVALAWGGPGHGWGWGRGNHEERQSAVASKVAEILGTDADETADAIAQAHKEVREEAADAALEDLAGRVAETLGTDSDATAEAIEQVAEEMRSEALEARLQSAIDDGDMTEEEAQEIRDKVAEQGWHSKDLSYKGGDAEDFAERVGALLEVDGEAVSGEDVEDAIKQALTDIRSEAMESMLQAAIDSGRITEKEAEEIREKIDSGDRDGFGKRGRHGRHGGKGSWGHRRGHHGSTSDPTATPEPVGDST